MTGLNKMPIGIIIHEAGTKTSLYHCVSYFSKITAYEIVPTACYSVSHHGLRCKTRL